MIEQEGIVVEADGQYAWVTTERQTSCGDCAAKPGCGTALLDRSVGKRFSRVKVPNTAGAKTGDCVVLGIPEQALLKGSFAIYMIPVVCLIAGAMGALFLGAETNDGWRDVASLLGGTVGFGIGLYWARYIGERGAGRSGFQPVLLRRLPVPRKDFASAGGFSG